MPTFKITTRNSNKHGQFTGYGTVTLGANSWNQARDMARSSGYQVKSVTNK